MWRNLLECQSKWSDEVSHLLKHDLAVRMALILKSVIDLRFSRFLQLPLRTFMYLLMLNVDVAFLLRLPSEWLRVITTLASLFLHRELVCDTRRHRLKPPSRASSRVKFASSISSTSSSMGSRKLRYVELSKPWFCLARCRPTFVKMLEDFLFGGRGGGRKQIVAMFVPFFFCLFSEDQVHYAFEITRGTYRFGDSGHIVISLCFAKRRESLGGWISGCH